MIVRLFRKLLSADALGVIFVIAALQVFTYGVAQSLRNTDTASFVLISLIALGIGFSLGKSRWNGNRSSVLIAALGFILVWILGARLTGPLQILGQAILSKTPEIVPTIQGKQVIDTTVIVEAWGTIA